MNKSDKIGLKGVGPTGAVQQKAKVPVHIDNFPLDLRVPFDVYAKEGSGFSCVVRKWTKFNQESKNGLQCRGITYLYVEGEPLQIKEYFDSSPGIKTVSNESYRAYSKDKELYHTISRAIFPAGARVSFSLYTVDNMRYVPILSPAGSPVLVTAEVRNAKGDLAIKVSDMNLFREYLAELSKKGSSAKGDGVRAAGVRENAKLNVRDFFSDPENPQNTDRVVDSANQIVNVLKLKEVGFKDLLTRRTCDFHVYTHSSNVAILAIAMAMAMGMEKKKIDNLAVGALMHDVGKGKLPAEVLCKREPLSQEEFSLWKKHVNEGIGILQNKGLSGDSLVAVRQHHERLSGGGYPMGLKGSAITVFGRIMSVVDWFDDLTTPRILKPALKPAEALNLIMKETREKGDFDSELVKLFIAILKGQGRV